MNHVGFNFELAAKLLHFDVCVLQVRLPLANSPDILLDGHEIVFDTKTTTTVYLNTIVHSYIAVVVFPNVMACREQLPATYYTLQYCTLCNTVVYIVRTQQYVLYTLHYSTVVYSTYVV